LVFRFSALGDVAMTVPVLQLLLKQHPQLQITVVSVPFMQPLFDGIERLRFYPADIRKEYKGVKGLYKLSRQLKKDIAFDGIADLHNVLRTKLLRFFLSGYPLTVIDKGRKEKKELTRATNKKLRPLKTTFQRYADVFEKLGLPVALEISGGIKPVKAQKQLLSFAPSATDKLVGIAPFAKHAAKMYPLAEMEQVVHLLSKQEGIKVLLIGSKAEAATLEHWQAAYTNVYSMAGRYSFADELLLIAALDIMVSMDSANMHLASLVGVPVVSVWGGTHPFLGFYGWGQPYSNAIQMDHPNRPSSVFGKEPCEGCMDGITPQLIVDKINRVLAK